MSSLETVLDTLARLLESEPEDRGSDGNVFELDGDQRLGIVRTPGMDGLVAWALVVDERGLAPAESEANAAELLRLRLARLRRSPWTSTGRNGRGDLIIHLRFHPESDARWLDGVGRLLDEAEILRRFHSRAAPGRPAGGMSSPFSIPDFRG